MKIVPLNKGYSTLVDDEDFDILMRQKWFVEIKGVRPKIYAKGHEKITGKCKMIYMHRFIMNIYDPKVEVDHIDGNSLNNQRNNLRLATRHQNGSNQLKQEDCSSKYKGIYWRKKKGKWQAQIKVNGVRIYLGIYKSEIEGAIAYNEAAKLYFGEFAKLNEIPLTT